MAIRISDTGWDDRHRRGDGRRPTTRQMNISRLRISVSALSADAHWRPSCSRLASYTQGMSGIRDELHSLVDQLPEERLGPVLQLIRGDEAAGRRKQALVTLAQVQERMRGVTGADEELLRLRDGDRG
jgi:hypothetical protein